MSATTAPPAVPPRPSRAQEMPKVPPRPINRRLERSVSPNHERFAQSPLNDPTPFLSKSPSAAHFGGRHGSSASNEAADRRTSVDMPSVGEEGREYEKMAEELGSSRANSTSPEQTRTVANDLKLHAPRPSLPAVSAKQRVMAVTRTDSDKAASFGIGKPSSPEDHHHTASSARSLKKKASTTSQLSTSESLKDDDRGEHGIPEIGQQVPMYPNAGDVQAPSPAPGQKHHNRRISARGDRELLPGSYGRHGHGMLSTDKLEKDYYSKHPEAVAKEIRHHHDDRSNDFSMSSEALNKIVRESASRGHGLGTSDLPGTPNEAVGWQAIEQTASRKATPRPGSTELSTDATVGSPLRKAFHPDISVSDADKAVDDGVIHVEEPRRRSVMFSDDEGEDRPILAADEIAKNPTPFNDQPAVEPPPERRGSAFEIDPPHSRPTSRPASIYKEASFEARSTPLEDVKEFEPLFPEDEKDEAVRQEKIRKMEELKQRFPSKDIWEDAPNSVHHTAEVSTPDITSTSQGDVPLDIPTRDGESPAQAFARMQEELAEKESREDPEGFLRRKQKAMNPYVAHQAHLAKEVGSSSRPGAHRFPSRDVWEDSPESHHLQTTVSTPQTEDESSPSGAKQPEIPQRPARKSTDPSSATSDKPSIPERPKPKQVPSEESIAKPAISDRPKPQVPSRPAKVGSGSDKDAEAAGPRAKPAVPARPMGSKIAALQAGLGLGQKLQLGPQAPKKEEPIQTEDLSEEKEKAPLADARKGRARGPQRRAPRSSPSPAMKEPTSERRPHPLSFSITTTVFSIDPDEGTVAHKAEDEEEPSDLETAPVPAQSSEPEPIVADEPAATVESGSGPAKEKVETLASNTAGETILEAKVDEDKDDNVEPREVADVAKD